MLYLWSIMILVLILVKCTSIYSIIYQTKRTKTTKTGSASVTKNVPHNINSTLLQKISVLKSYTIIMVNKTEHTKYTVKILVQMPTFVSLYLGFSVKIILVSLLALLRVLLLNGQPQEIYTEWSRAAYFRCWLDGSRLIRNCLFIELHRQQQVILIYRDPKWRMWPLIIYLYHVLYIPLVQLLLNFSRN